MKPILNLIIIASPIFLMGAYLLIEEFLKHKQKKQEFDFWLSKKAK